MDIKEFKEIIGAMENGEQLLEVFQNHDNNLRNDIEKAKAKKGEVVTQKSEIETVLTGLLEKLQAKTPDEANGKISEFETKLQKALEDVGGLTEKFNLSEAEKAKAEKERELALRDSDFVGALSEKGIKDPNGIILAAMKQLAVKDESNGGWKVGEVDPLDFLQGQIDSKEPMFNNKTKTEIPPQPIDTSKVNEAREAMGLPPKE